MDDRIHSDDNCLSTHVDVTKTYGARKLTENPLLRPGDTIFVPKSTLSKIAPFIPRPGVGLYVLIP
jgi:hypothetical protein